MYWYIIRRMCYLLNGRVNQFYPVGVLNSWLIIFTYICEENLKFLVKLGLLTAQQSEEGIRALRRRRRRCKWRWRCRIFLLNWLLKFFWGYQWSLWYASSPFVNHGFLSSLNTTLQIHIFKLPPQHTLVKFSPYHELYLIKFNLQILRLTIILFHRNINFCNLFLSSN
jgi:hypothetical protein